LLLLRARLLLRLLSDCDDELLDVELLPPLDDADDDDDDDWVDRCMELNMGMFGSEMSVLCA
jgi:hypothetical protein